MSDRKRLCGIIGVAWLAMIGFDFLLHGGLLAYWYVDPPPFLLPPKSAFARIPLGYVSFLMIAILLVIGAVRFEAAGWRRGAAFGLRFGAILWGAFCLGMYSITTAPVWLLVGWFLGQTIEMGLAGILVGMALAGDRTRTLLVRAIFFCGACIVLTLVLQATGLAPAVKV